MDKMPSPEMVELYRLIAIWGIGVIGMLVATIATIFNQRQNRMSAQIDKTVTQENFEKKLGELDEQRKQFHSDQMRKLDEIAGATKVIASQAVELGRLDIRVQMLEERNAYMGKWKHEVIDPFIPGEITNLARRVAALENRIDGSHHHKRESD